MNHIKKSCKALMYHFRHFQIINKHKNVSKYWDKAIYKYYNGELEKDILVRKQEIADKIIWQYWGQGIENAPEIIKICFNSVDKYCGEYTVIRLSDDNISDYVDLPAFVYQKLNTGDGFTRTFFSDLLRLALLHLYGGIWLDATILLTDKIEDKCNETDFFVYQRSENELNKEYWKYVYYYYFSWDDQFKVRMLSSIIFSKRGSLIITALLDLILFYWKTETKIKDYFFFQVLFNQLTYNNRFIENCRIENDCVPHLFQTKLNGGEIDLSYNEIIKMTNIHKMSYFDEKRVDLLKQILNIK